MADPKELRQSVVETRAEAQKAFHEAHDTWDVKPGGAAEGEEAWCPREVAQHMIGAEWYFTNLIVQACGAPAMERPQIEVATPGDAAATYTRIGAANDAMLRHLSQDDLSKTIETKTPLGEASVERIVGLMVGHGRDHIEQLRAACV